ncbi:MAG: hypothetical protein ACREFP_22450 [Acetobacteraceae bacterium]
MTDSLSVFSSFNAKTNASSGAGTSGGAGVDVGLGKVFATGIAAQQLTEGQGFYLKEKGLALSNAAACLANLKKVLGNNAATADQAAAICGSNSATTSNRP